MQKICVLDAPIVRLNGGGIIAENKRLILTCIVDAYPSIDSYQWYKNDQKINVTELTSSLIIDKVSKYDTGIYTCLAKNTLKYPNGSTVQKFDKTQTHVTIECKFKLLPDLHSPSIFRCSNCEFINTDSCF
jgi:hypothetical protein